MGGGRSTSGDCGVHVSVSVGVWAGPVGWVLGSLGVVDVCSECGRDGGGCWPILTVIGGLPCGGVAASEEEVTVGMWVLSVEWVEWVCVAMWVLSVEWEYGVCKEGHRQVSSVAGVLLGLCMMHKWGNVGVICG